MSEAILGWDMSSGVPHALRDEVQQKRERVLRADYGHDGCGQREHCEDRESDGQL